MHILFTIISSIFLIFFQLSSGNAFAEDQGKVLMVVTNTSQIQGTNKPTGYFLPELSHPYYTFTKAGFDVDFASPLGGYAPVDPRSIDLSDADNKAFYNDHGLMNQTGDTISISDINPKYYKAIFFVGGHGPMWDFPNSESLQKVTRQIYENGDIVAALCHGPAALINVKLSNGSYLIEGKSVTSFTNEEEDTTGVKDKMPFLLETSLIERGAKFKKAPVRKVNVVIDGRLVTGQNPASSYKTAEAVIKLIQEK
ncbi:type 1 glutamine amidotransferase domain-containing protein [uncultured Microbulbifer sp.]|uniref:type 1 glutamine amidotransferase domain-containing protein n=1 Tax=uncultured Microbulbifer sp. TaxID=348147 RepID=UPI00260826B5|nr:type 1 glutamine amidotransferase domain-containing protein [uncultured Microbulbifer sp.]